MLFYECSCQEIKRKETTIESIEVYAIDWTLLTRVRQNAEDIRKYKKIHKHFYVKDEAVLTTIAKRLDNLIIKEGYNGVDVRMTCYINYESGEKEELNFGGTKLAYYRNQCYEKDTILINLIEANPVYDTTLVDLSDHAETK